MPAMRALPEVAEELGIAADHVIGWGPGRAKVDPAATGGQQGAGRLVLVSSITPTAAGEGKTTIAIALAMALRAQGRRSVVVLREPSLGPVFGIKGGGTGGGAATLEPAEAINLHFTGDLHAVTSAHNLLSALVDNAVQFAQSDLDPRRLTWPRAIDMNDRFLRHVVVGLGGPTDGVPREASFQITAASEVMAVLCLAADLPDLQARLGRIVVGWTAGDQPVTAAAIGAAPAMTALLRDALMPNLVQTADGTPALVHGGPFANIAHGTSSVIAARLALSTGADVITEAGFGFDLGGQKFLDIACPSAGIWPRVVVLVVTLRALQQHGTAVGGALRAGAGSDDPHAGDGSDSPHPGASSEAPRAGDGTALRRGLAQLDRHLSSVAAYGLVPVVAINRFPMDDDADVDLVLRWCTSHGVAAAASTGFTEGAAGSLALAEVVAGVLDSTDEHPPRPWHPYDPGAGYLSKVQAVAQQVYGAADVEATPRASAELARITDAVGTGLPVCIAKTHLSLSDDPARPGVPHGFTITARDAHLAAGAGFVVVSTGSIVTMPGLPRRPAALRVRVDGGRIRGLMAGEAGSGYSPGAARSDSSA